MTKQGTVALSVVGGVGLVCIIGLALHGPTPQDPAYHAFADQRTILGIPNFCNVVSNIAFLPVGVAGLAVLRRRSLPGVLEPLYPAYVIFFAATILVAFGSGYYHLNPSNSTLLWDRLPMTFAFMAFVTIVLGEHIDAGLARRALLPLTALGVGSVLYWAVTETHGHGDLRPYVVVQFLPLALIPLVLLSLRSVFSTASHLWLVLACYAGAKALELLDVPVYEMGHLVSGHTLKHVVAALGMWFMVPAMWQRSVVHRAPDFTSHPTAPVSHSGGSKGRVSGAAGERGR